MERGKAPYGDGGDGGDVVAPPGERVLSGLLDQQQHAQRGGALIHLSELGLARQVDRLLLHLQSGTGVRGRVRGVVGGARWWWCARVASPCIRDASRWRTFFRAMAMAFTAWLIEPAPIAVTFIRRPSRAKLEIAPASTLASVPLALFSCCASTSPVVRRAFFRIERSMPVWPSSSEMNSGCARTGRQRRSAELCGSELRN